MLLLLLRLLRALLCHHGVGCRSVGRGRRGAALSEGAVVVAFEAVLQTKGLLAQLARDRHKLLLTASFEGARVLSRLGRRCWAACPDVRVDDGVQVVARLHCDGLHAQRADGGVAVVARLGVAAVVFVPVVGETKLLAAAVALCRHRAQASALTIGERGRRRRSGAQGGHTHREGQKVALLAASAERARMDELGELHQGAAVRAPLPGLCCFFSLF